MTTDWPGDSATVVRWVRAALQRMGTDDQVEVKGLDDVTVSAELTGTDLQHLTLDATGVKLRLRFHPGASTPPGSADTASAQPEPEPEPLVRTAGIAKSFRFVARPMRIERTPVTVDVQVRDVPITWLTFAEPTESGFPESIHAILPDDHSPDINGTFLVSTATKDLVPLVTSVLRPMLRAGGIRLGRVRLDVATDGGDGIRATAYAGFRWKLLMASARADASIQVTRDAVVTVRDLTVGSRNLLVKVGLLFVRRSIRKIVGQSFDLNAMLTEDDVPVRVHDLRVEAGVDLTVAARFS